MADNNLEKAPDRGGAIRATHDDLWGLWWAVHSAITALALQKNPKASNLDLARKWLRQNGVERMPNNPKTIREQLEGLEFPLEF